MMNFVARQQPLTAKLDSSSSTRYVYEDDNNSQGIGSTLPSPRRDRYQYQSTTSTEIVDMYRRTRPNYDSIALANPFHDNTASVWNVGPYATMGYGTPIPPLPGLTDQPAASEPKSALQYSALNQGLQGHYTRRTHNVQVPHRKPVNDQLCPSSDSIYPGYANDSYAARYQPRSQPLPTNTPADKTWEGSYLRKGTLRFDTKAQKKLDRKALKEEEKAMKRRFTAEKKEAKRIAQMRKREAIQVGL